MQNPRPGFELLVPGALPHLGLCSSLAWTPGQSLSNTCHGTLNSQDLHFGPHSLTSVPILLGPTLGSLIFNTSVFRSLTGRGGFPVWAGPPTGLGLSRVFPRNTAPDLPLSAAHPAYLGHTEKCSPSSGEWTPPPQVSSFFPFPVLQGGQGARPWAGSHASGPRHVLGQSALARKPIVLYSGILWAGCE